jgi:hypothetical protein
MPFQPPPPDAFQERVRSRVVELRSLNVYDYQPISIPLWCQLNSTNTRGNAQFITPPQKRLVILGVTPVVNILQPSQEVIANLGSFVYNGGGPTTVFAGGNVRDRLMAKALNCVIDFWAYNQDIQINFNRSICLGDFYTGGVETNWLDNPTPWPDGSTFDLFASLNDSTAAGSTTEYGLRLDGFLVRL